MSFTAAKVYSELNFSEHLVIGHPYYPSRPAFLLVRRGWIKVKEQIHTHDLGPYSIILIDSNSVYEILDFSPNIKVILIAYDRDFVEQLNFKFNRLKAYSGIRSKFKNSYVADKEEFTSIWKNLENLKYYIESEETNEYLIEVIETFFTALIYQFGNIINRNRRLSKDLMSRSQEIVLDFIKLVSNQYLEEKSVDFYAQKMMISTRHLSTVLKQEIGKSASEVISEFILNAAKAKLSSTRKPINVIARELQFSDQYSFSHFFKKHEGLSPSQYRNQF